LQQSQEAKLEKNRQSARECRRRKKEYVTALEEKIDEFAAQNTALRTRVGEMEKVNKELVAEMAELRARLAGFELKAGAL
jgi:regulator of replication initiation timing